MADNTKKYNAGETVFKEGELSAEAYILLSGTLEIIKGDKVLLELSESGSFIGEMAVLLGKPRTATVVAKTDVELGVVTEENFSTMVQKMPTVAFKLAKSIAERLEETTKELVEIKNSKIEKVENSNSDIYQDNIEFDKVIKQSEDCFEKMDFDNALQKWESALNLAENNKDKYMLYNNIGSCYLLKHDVEKSMLYFTKALKIKPNGKEIMLNFGLVYLLLGDYVRAKNLLEKVAKIFPDCTIALENLKILMEVKNG